MIALFHFHSHRPKRNKNTSCIFIHKIINNVNIGCLYNQLQFTYCSPEWVESYGRSFPSSPLSNYSVFSWRTSCAHLRSATQNFCVLLFHSEQSLNTALQGASPLARWAPFEVLQYQNRANSLKWNMWRLFLHVLKHRQIIHEQKMKIKTTLLTYSLAKVCTALLSSTQSCTLGLLSTCSTPVHFNL